jgi:hypothetical protein
MSADEIHTYGDCEYRREDGVWRLRALSSSGYWYAIVVDGEDSPLLAMLDALHPLPDPPPVTVTLGEHVWTKDGGFWVNHRPVGVPLTLGLALDRIVELGGADQ